MNDYNVLKINCENCDIEISKKGQKISSDDLLFGKELRKGNIYQNALILEAKKDLSNVFWFFTCNCCSTIYCKNDGISNYFHFLQNGRNIKFLNLGPMAAGQKKEITVVLDIRRYNNAENKQNFSFVLVDILNEQGEMIQALLKEKDLNGNIKIIDFLDNMNLKENEILFQELEKINFNGDIKLFDIVSKYDDTFSYFSCITKNLHNYIQSNNKIDYIISDDKDILLSLAAIDRDNKFVYVEGEETIGFTAYATNLFLFFNCIRKNNIEKIQKIIEKFENQYGCEVIEVATLFYENIEDINDKLRMQVSYFFELQGE